MYKFMKITCFILVIIGAINWGLIGVFDFDLVSKLFGEMTKLSRLIYSLVGLAGIILLIMAPICYRHHYDNDM